MSAEPLTVDEIARTSDDAAVRARFDARNLAWARVLLLFGFLAVGGTTIAMLANHAPLRAAIALANFVALFIARRKTRPSRNVRHVTAFVAGGAVAQMALFVIFAARSEGLIPIVAVLPFLLIGFRMQPAELLLMHGGVAAAAILGGVFVPPPIEGTQPAVIVSSIVDNGIAVAIELAFSKRMRREVTADFGSRRLQAREQLRMRDELRYAREIQLSMLPECAPALPWVDVAGLSIPASEVGGDYYDYFLVGDRLAIVAGDVAGHGLASGIVLAAMRSGFTLLRDSLVDPADVLTRLHVMIAETSRRRMLIACCVLLLDRAARRATIASAGHPPLLIRRADGSVERFELFASPLGVRLPLTIPSAQTPFAPGDFFVLHTDGAYEARNLAGDSYGIERIEEVLRDSSATTAAEMRDAIARDVAAFRGAAPQDDDLTIVVARIASHHE